jgi:PAS domain S-box-containing protein
MAERIAIFDWSATSLGPIQAWPLALRISLNLCLNNRFPMHVWWGTELINLYNDAHISILGNRHPAALGRPAASVWADIWPILSPQVEAVMVRGESTWNASVEVSMNRDGAVQPAWFTWSYSPIMNADGTVGGLICVATDDTVRILAERERDRFDEQSRQHRDKELARADEAVRDSMTLLRGISDSTGDVIFAKDRQGRMRFANPATLALIGKPIDQVIGKTDEEFLENKASARAAMENDRRVMESGIAADFEELVPLPDGTERVWFSRKMPYRDADGNIAGLLGISRDITDRKRELDESRRAREAAETASKAKDRLLAVVSHELRTPLNPILAITSYLQNKPDLPAALREDIDTIRRNVEQEARIVDDLLNVTRLQRGKIILHQEAIDLHTLLRSATEQVSAQCDARNIALRADLFDGQAHVWADPGRMQQVLSNLIDNAIKFTPDGGKIVVRSSLTPERRICVEFIDNGVGIEPEVLPKLFTPFEQGETTVTRKFGGLGLGLVVVKGIMDLHGGTIRVASDGKDKGATLSVELAAMDLVVPQRQSPPRSAGDASGVGKTILLVEDHEDTRRIMQRILKNLGYGVLTASNFQEAMQRIQADRFDLLLSDIGLPDGSGLDLMRALRGTRNVPGVALSGFGNDEDLRRSREAGFSRHLVKPVDLTKLDATVRSTFHETATFDLQS